jgi:hypothetical protein
MKAMLFYEDKGTFSRDVADADSGPPYVPPKLWNTPMQYENRSTSVLVTIEVTGDGETTPPRKLEFSARYIPLHRTARELVVRKVVPISLAVKAGRQRDNYNVGFWLYDTGCDPVKISARILGQRNPMAMKRVIKFGCGE